MDQTQRQGKENHEHTHSGREFGRVHQVQEREHHDHEHLGFEKEHIQKAQQKLQPHENKLHEHHRHDFEHVTIFIDHEPFKAVNYKISGAELRNLPTPPIGAEMDIYHVVPGKGENVKIANTDIVEVCFHEAKHGRHFYSAPKTCHGKQHLGKPAQPSHEEIAAKAFAIYQSKGCQHGHDTEHWLEAERSCQ